MQRFSRTITLSFMGLTLLGLTAFAQETPQAAPQQQQPLSKEAMAARRQAMAKLTSDFSVAVKNGSLSANDQQKAQDAIAKLQPHMKGAARDPQARHQAMQFVRQMSTNPSLRPEDRDLLAKDLAAVAPNRPQNNN
jgi:hypothetical protein